MEAKRWLIDHLTNLGAAPIAAMTSVNFPRPPPSMRAVTLKLRVLTPINAARRNVR
jgi:hypothetical protein